MSSFYWLFAYYSLFYEQTKNFRFFFLVQIVFQIHTWLPLKTKQKKKKRKKNCWNHCCRIIIHWWCSKWLPLRSLTLFVDYFYLVCLLLSVIFPIISILFMSSVDLSASAKQICPHSWSTFCVSIEGSQRCCQIQIDVPKFIRIVMRHRINWRMIIFMSPNVGRNSWKLITVAKKFDRWNWKSAYGLQHDDADNLWCPPFVTIHDSYFSVENLKHMRHHCLITLLHIIHNDGIDFQQIRRNYCRHKLEYPIEKLVLFPNFHGCVNCALQTHSFSH